MMVVSYDSCRIKGAVFMNMRVIQDTESDWPNALPSKEHFENSMSKVSGYSGIM